MGLKPNIPRPETVSRAGRLGELAVIALLLILAAFFWLHLSQSTGFFTAGFGPLAAAALFGPIVIALVPPALRAATGRRNPARPFEAAANLALALGSLYLLITFPLSYAHLADLLPAWLRFLLAWITDGIGRAVMVFQVVFMPISAAVNLWRYFSPPRRPAPNPS